MIRWLKQLFFGKKLEDHLNETKIVRVSGVRFKIRKLNMLNYLEGSQVLLRYFDTYKSGQVPDQLSTKKVNEHVAQVLVAGTVQPKLSLKEGDGVQYVYDLFSDAEMVNGLYSEILTFAYGKKKVATRILQGTNSPN